MTASSTGWIATLEQLEADIERFEAELEAGEVVESAAWVPPSALGPLPVELRQRATSLSWRMTAVEQRARDRRDSLQQELDDLGRRRGAGAAYAAAGPDVVHRDEVD
jgi:hypothetical protein